MRVLETENIRKEFPESPRVPTAVLFRGLLSPGVFFLILGVLIFLPAGDVRWAKGWLFLLVFMEDRTLPNAASLRSAAAKNDA